jgi:hypothetical protein
MKDTNSSNGDLLSNKMNVKLYVLRPSMLHRVSRGVDSTDIIKVNNCGSVHRAPQLLQKVTKPTSLSNHSSHPTVFGFST